MEWAYGEIDDFYITDAVWMALDCHKGLNDVLKSGEINTQDIKDIIAQNTFNGLLAISWRGYVYCYKFWY